MSESRVSGIAITLRGAAGLFLFVVGLLGVARGLDGDSLGLLAAAIAFSAVLFAARG